MIEFEDVRIAYKDKPVLDGVSLTIHDREFFVLIGSSGCGKTTLLKSINKLLPLRGGSLSIDGIPVEQIKVQDLPKKVGYVVQSGDLLVVPPALEADARDILVADFINGTKNTMQGTAEIHVEPRLASDSAWFLLCTKRPVKPLIYQQRKKAKFVSKTNETDDNVFMSKKFIYGADSRGNAGFGFWQMAYGSDGTTT